MTVQNFIENYTSILKARSGKIIEQTTMREQYEALAELTMQEIGAQSQKKSATDQSKEVYYFSMEFLMGRLLTNNLMNLGLYQTAKKALAELNLDITAIETSESDAGLGNGGLGRLAACFLDSAASQNLRVHGNTIRYQYGFFDQTIKDGKQFEHVQQWLYESAYEWEIARPELKEKISYGGSYQDGIYTPEIVVVAMPYDVPVVGYGAKTINHLRMWQAHPDPMAVITGNFAVYESEIKQISNFLYPDDSTEDGKKLRLMQQYFFVSAGAQALVTKHLNQYKTLDTLAEKVTIQINDTHPTIVIPELLRIFIDEHGYKFDDAWAIICKTVAFTNHTLLSEALECWSKELMAKLFPRLYPLIVEIDKRYQQLLAEKGIDEDMINRLAIITKTNVQMAYLAIAGSFSVNGVAALHTELLIGSEMVEMAEVYPNKFNNKTNGITHRRWLMYANPELSALITKKIGDNWITNLEPELLKLRAFSEDTGFLAELLAVKQTKKEQLAQFILEQTGITVKKDAIFDIQVKRLHAYKRQLLNSLHILHLYLEIKKDPTAIRTPRVFIFGAKAAPSYVLAKEIIYFINVLADVINNDAQIGDMLKVVFMPNYNVSAAEYIFPAADISEQISTAGKEASGTGNMKFMMNGALTLGTLDGATVEIADLAGSENNFIFGMDVAGINTLRDANTYNAKAEIADSPMLQEILSYLEKPTKLGSKLIKDDMAFQTILDDLITQNDSYLVLADFAAYVQAQKEIAIAYQNKTYWAKMMLANIAASGFFTSDRTIREYDRDIWHLSVNAAIGEGLDD
ncbi:glycogen phosphorylase [Erysipelotrichaceae bacterium]|nr:glycogen phosphorylase [Erysipelotrichaceae bacterium]